MSKKKKGKRKISVKVIKLAEFERKDLRMGAY